jgi:hypothetical protein
VTNIVRAGFTGTSLGMSNGQLIMLTSILGLGVTHFHHGDCVGADAQAHDLARAIGLKIEVHPPVVDRKRAFCQGATVVHNPKPYLERNQDIVDVTDFLIATPYEFDEQDRGGTWSTIRYARRHAEKSLIIIKPNGRI